MNELLAFISDTIGAGVLLSIPAVLIQLGLRRVDVARENPGFIVAGIFAAVIIKSIWFNEISWVCFGPLVIVGSILSMNRGDLWQMMQKGKLESP